jgi:hypothetical protein
MTTSRVLVFGLPLAAGALAWWLLARAQQEPYGYAREEVIPARPRSALDGPAAMPELPKTEVVPLEPADPEWITKPLALPEGQGPLKGTELIRAVEAGRKLRFKGATEADLEALRRAVFEDVDRTAPQPYAAMMGWLKEAGFEVEVVYPDLVVRRRTDEDFTSR